MRVVKVSWAKFSTSAFEAAKVTVGIKAIAATKKAEMIFFISAYPPNAVVASSAIIFERTNAPMAMARPKAEKIIVRFDLSRCSGLPELVIYPNPPQTKNPTDTAPAKVIMT